jgi:hypothetical protein
VISVFKNLSIKTTIITAVCAIILMVTIGVTVSWVLQMQRFLYDQTEERLHSNVETVTLILDAFKMHTKGLLDTVSVLPQTQDVLAGGNNETMNFILRHIHYGMRTGDRHILYDNFLVLNAQLETVAFAHPGTPDISFLRENFCTYEILPGEMWTSSVNQQLGWMNIWYAMPIMNGDQFAGLAAISVNTRALHTFFNHYREHSYLINIAGPTGVILFSNRMEYIGRHANDLGLEKDFQHMPRYTVRTHTSAITGLEQLVYLSEYRFGWTIISFFYVHEMENVAWVIFLSVLPIVLGIIPATMFLLWIITKTLNPLKFAKM